MGPVPSPRAARALAVVALAAGLVAGCTSHTESGGSRLAQADSWSSVTGGPPNSGRAHGSPPDAPDLLWSRVLGAPAIGVAASDGIGTSFQATISERGCNLFALTAGNGRKQWCSRLPTDGPRITATVDGRGSLFVPLFGGVAAVADGGEHRWFVPTRGVPTTITLLDNRHLLVISHQGAAAVVNSHTGLENTPSLRLAGEITTTDRGYGLPWCGIGEKGCPVPGPAAVDTDSATAYLTVWTPGAEVPDLVAVRYRPAGEKGATAFLEEMWRVPLRDGRLGVPVVLSDDRSTLYVHSADGTLGAFSTVDGSGLWSVPLDYRPDLPPAVLPDGTVVTGGRTTTVWKGPRDGHDDAGPAPVVAVRGEDGSGRELWRRDDLQQLTNPAATADGRVVVAVRSDATTFDAGGSDAGGADDPGGTDEPGGTIGSGGTGEPGGPGIALHILDGGDGRTLHRIAVPAATGPVSGLSIDSDGRIALTTAAGAVYVFG